MIRPGIRRLFRLPVRRGDLAERELDDEIRLHLELRAERLRRQGLDPEEARAEALRRFGPPDETRRVLRRAARRREERAWLRERALGVRQDLRFAARSLRRSPGFLAVAIATLALGIGANTALFSVVRSVLLRPLPYPEPDRVVTLWQDHQGRGGVAEERFSLPDFSALRARTRTLGAVAAVYPGDAALTGEPGAERVSAPNVSHEYFDLFGVRPALGRFFRPEDETLSPEPLVVLGHDLWQRRFGADPGIVGRSLMLDGTPHTVIGVAEAGFRPPEGPSDLWSPIRSDPAGVTWRFYVLRVFGRLRPEVALDRAREDLDALSAHLAAEHPERNEGVRVRLRLETLRERVVGPARAPLWVLMGAAGMVLLLACVNLANLLLARTSVRQREMAIRAALGAGRGRIVRQLLTESLVLAGAGGLLGVGLGHLAMRALVVLAPAGMPRLDEVSIDATVLAFAVVLSLGTGVAFGLAPAVWVAGSDLRGALSGTGSGGGAALGRRRSALVVSQVAIALVLLAGAALLAGSLVRLLSVDPGFDPSGVLTAELRAPRSRYPDRAQVVDFYNRLEERIAGLPGVRSVGSVTTLPLTGESSDAWLRVEGRGDGPPEEQPRAHYRFASPGYFRAMGMALRAGRPFDGGDRLDAPGVVIVNETMARRLWPGEDPLGRRIGPEWDPDGWHTVVGVVADVRHGGLDRGPLPEIYLPAEQLSGAAGFRTLVVRTGSDPLRLAAPVREVVRELDPSMPVDNVSTMEARLDDSVAMPRMYLSLFGLFAGLALGLAALGIYGVLSAAVASRTREIGIRMALGGRRRDVLRLVVGRGLALAGAGAVLGLAGALALTRLMRGMLFGIAPTDPLTLAAVSLLVISVALMASYLPAQRASRVDPMVALRRE